MASVSRSTPTVDVSHKEMAERDTRIAEMLERWSADDVSEEPEWGIEDLEPLTLRHGTDPEKRRT